MAQLVEGEGSGPGSATAAAPSSEQLDKLGPAPPWETAKRVFREYQNDNGGDWAAALTYYSVLSLFPGLLVLLALLGVLGTFPATTNALLDIVGQLGPASAVDTLRSPIESVTKSSGGAGALLGVGLIGAIWSASGYLGAFARASNVIYEVEEGRPFWKLRPQQVGITILMLILLAFLLVGLVVTGPVAESIGNVIGLGSQAVTVWGIAKWPVMLAVVSFLFAILYYWAPNVQHPGFKLVTPGSALAVVLWILASGAFALYVTNFSSYNATYGSLGGVIVFLLWIWITNNAVLLGQELNAELERQREVAKRDPGPDGTPGLRREPSPK